MWKFVNMSSHCIFEHYHIMYWTSPSWQHKGKRHVEITNNKHILSDIIVFVQILNLVARWHHNLYMCPIYCSYTIIEVWQKFGCSKLGCTSENFGSLGLIMLGANRRIQVKTLSNVRLIVSRDLTKCASSCLTNCSAPTIHKNIARGSIDDICDVHCNSYDSTKLLCSLLNKGLSTLNIL
jgi:hypothetical protein